MQKNSLDQALAERRQTQAEADAKQRLEAAKHKQRYVELIKSGSGDKAAVDELLKLTAQLGVTERQMYQDIGNIEVAHKMVSEIESLAGVEVASKAILDIRDRLAEIVRRDLHALQLQFKKLNDLVTLAQERCREFRSVRAHLDDFKKSHPELLAGIKVPDASIAYEARPAGEVVPELRVWEADYIEVHAVPFDQAALTAAPGSAAEDAMLQVEKAA